MDIAKALAISARGLDVQTARLRTLAENLARRESAGVAAEAAFDAIPSCRTVISLENPRTQAAAVRDVPRPGTDTPLQYGPLVADVEMPESQCVHRGNLEVLDASRAVLSRTVALLK